MVSSNFPRLVSSIDTEINFGQKCELFIILRRCNAGSLDTQSCISEAMQGPKVGKILFKVEVLKTSVGSFFGFMSRLSGKSKVSDACRRRTVL